MISFLASCFDPRAYLHALRMLHYWNYSHVQERRKLINGGGTRISPTVSFRNAERIRIGSKCHLGERCHLWAGDTEGEIHLGNDVSLAPGVFITASDYQFVSGIPFKSQPKRERNVTVGDDVWLGAGVVVVAGVTIGDGCVIGAGAVVTKDVPANSIAAGIPAKVVAMRPEGAAQST